MLVKDIAEIHNQPLSEINRRINDNKKRFKENVDVIDFLNGSEPFRDLAKENGWIGSNRTKNVYLLSERGYAKLLKIMEDDLAWEMYDKLVDEYFQMRKVIKENVQQGISAKEVKEMLDTFKSSNETFSKTITEMSTGFLDTVVQMNKSFVDAIVKINSNSQSSSQANNQTDTQQQADQTTQDDQQQVKQNIQYYTLEDIANGFGIIDYAHKPHVVAVKYIITKKIKGYEKYAIIKQTNVNNKITKTEIYSAEVVRGVKAWLDANDWPQTIVGANINKIYYNK